MNRDLLKTVGGVLLIAAIVVATFLYGNKQRQEQVARDQEATQQEQANQPAADQQPASDQPATGQPPAPSGVGGPTAQAPATTPETGGEVLFLIPAAAMAVAYQAKRSSHRQLRDALVG